MAEEERRLVGYALISRYFDTDPCAWCSYMQDLYVVPERRSQRIGRHLIAAVARWSVEQGRLELSWHVRITIVAAGPSMPRLAGVRSRSSR
ncbi:MAG: GNAT family N-acetyltransferase [Geminicoccaceae bacterium]